MNLWGGRFTKPTNQLVYDFNASIEFDQTFYQQDIQGSIAHVKMLTKQKILSNEEGKQIEAALKQILDEHLRICTVLESPLVAYPFISSPKIATCACSPFSKHPPRRCRRRTTVRYNRHFCPLLR